MKRLAQKYLFSVLILLVLSVTLFSLAHAAYAYIIFYGENNVPYLQNSHVRWPDEPRYVNYEDDPDNWWDQGPGGQCWFEGFDNPVSFDIIESKIENNTGFKVEIIPIDDTEGYYLRNDVYADENLYFDIIGYCYIMIRPVSDGVERAINLKDNKITLTVRVDKFDERITSDRNLTLLASKYFYEDMSDDDHYYVMADETSVDIENKTLTMTISDPSRLFRCGETLTSEPGSFGGDGLSYGHIMLAYVMDGEDDLTPEPILHASSSDLADGDDTMGVTLSVIPSSVDTDLLVRQEDGTYILDPDKATEDVPEFKDGNMIPIPVFDSNVKPGGIAIVTQSITVNALREKTFADIAVLKGRSDGTVGKLKWASTPAKVGDGEYYISEKRTGTVVDKTSTPKAGRQYVLYMGIKDNGEYDLDPTEGKIFDPAILASRKTGSASGDSGGGGGCNAGGGFAVFSAFLLIPFFCRRYKKD